MVRLAAEFGGEVTSALWQAATASGDGMLASPERATEIGNATAAALESIAAVKGSVFGAGEPVATTANLGALRSDRANIVLHGHVAPAVVKALATIEPRLNVVALCGSEISGPLAIAPLSNYDSQEAALLTGAVDLLVLGSQCVMPSTVAMAQRAGIAMLRSAELADAGAIERAVELATASCARRQGRSEAPAHSVAVKAGYTAGNSGALLQAFAKAHAAGALRGLVYLGGCGNLAHTQDAGFVRTATHLIGQGYAVATAGCAGTALAKAGLCRPEAAAGTPLAAMLPAGTPPLLHLGSCHDAGAFLGLARNAAALGLPVFALVQELTHNKVLATALAFGARGIPTLICVDEVEMPAGALAGVTVVASLDQVPRAFSEMAAA